MADLATDPLAAGSASLAAGDWTAARAAFEVALEHDDPPAARDGLARALWWLEGPARAVEERTHAYAGYRRAGDGHAAAHVALWIAHEYEVGLGNPAAAGGWLTRAAGLLERLPEDTDHARLELVRSERAGDPLEAGRHAKVALEIARRLRDPDLEITALGRLGLAEVRVGAVESGMSRLDEAMAAALGGEATELETLGELGGHAPGEVLERVVVRVPGRQDGGSRALDVTLLVSGDGTDPVGRDDPTHRPGNDVAGRRRDVFVRGVYSAAHAVSPFFPCVRSAQAAPRMLEMRMCSRLWIGSAAMPSRPRRLLAVESMVPSPSLAGRCRTTR